MLTLLIFGFISSYLEHLSEPTRIGIFAGVYLLIYVYAIFRRHGGVGSTAGWLSALAPGAGQLYNRQFIKFIFFLGLSAAGLYYFIQSDGRNLATVILLVIMIVSIIDGNLYAGKSVLQKLQKHRKRAVKDKLRLITDMKEKGHEIGVHTDVLLYEPDLLLKMLDEQQITLFFSKQVLDEIESLIKKSKTRTQAEVALEVIEEFQRQGALQFIETPSRQQLIKLGLKQTTDEKIIGTYLSHDKNIALLSNQKITRVIARQAGLPVV